MNAKREELEKKRLELIERINKIRGDRTNRNGAYSANLEDQSLELENREVLDALEKVERAELVRVEKELSQLPQ